MPSKPIAKPSVRQKAAVVRRAFFFSFVVFTFGIGLFISLVLVVAKIASRTR